MSIARRLALAWRLARRELRGGLAGFRVFLASLALGVAAIAAVGTLSAAVIGGLKADARALLGGDVEIQLSQRPPDVAEAAWQREQAAKVSDVIEMRAMPRAGDARALVELKAVDGAYPLVGRLDLSPAQPLDQALSRRDGTWGAVAEAALLAKLGIGIGERIRLGEAEVEVRAVVDREPDRVTNVISFGPRLMVAAGALADAGLVQPGSLYRHNTRALLPAGTDPGVWAAAAREAFPTAGWQIRDAAGAAPGVRRFVDRLGMFLTFAGLAALLIGGLGVANAVRHYLAGKAETIATLKCLGASGPLIVDIYLIQVLILTAAGILAGLILGTALPMAALGLLAERLPIPVDLGLSPQPLLVAAGMGLLTALTFALWPLGRARNVPAAGLFRGALEAGHGRPRLAYILAAGASGVALAVLTITTAHNPGFAGWFVAGAVLTLAILRGAAALLMALAARMPRPRQASLRLAITGLHRSDAPTPGVIVSLGAGLTVLVAIALIDSNTRAQIGERPPESVPAFFFIDIPSSQGEAFDALTAAVPGVGNVERVPSLRGRIVAIAGVPVDRAEIAADATWAVRGDRALTHSAMAPADAEIVEGSWWPEDYAGPPLLSLDADLARGFGVGLGDTITLNVLGREITAEIASLRQIDWRAVPFDFAMILSPATLAGAPHTQIAAVYAPKEAEAALERAVTDRFTNVTAIRTREALSAVTDLLDRIAWAVRAAAALTLVAGALVLAGAVAADRRRRTFEAVVFKVLGATRARIAGTYLVEYGVLGLVTAAIAAGLGTAVGWAVSVKVMDFAWSMRWDIVVTTVAICVVLSLAVGFAGTWRILGQKAAPYLRNE
ncbi:MAG TPA: FtsX-like permease family protein [Rhodospirillales bacterium]|nr:FtsX-like permease family protein [Rhodospirillales bacterium]